MVQFGINLNPRHPVGQPADMKALQGVKWARIVFQAAATRESIDQAFNFYDPLVDRYNSVGARTLLVVNQETFWGHGPWDHGDWDRYAREFAEALRPIVARYRGKGVAYEIWNEGDIRGHSSVFVPPVEFAKVMKAAYDVVKATDPAALVVVGGLAAGAGDAVAYVREMRKALGGKLPADAIGIHPYGQWTPNFGGKPGWGGWFGQITDYLSLFVNAFPSTPLWITEIGVSEAVVFPPDQYMMVAKYMEGISNIVRTRYAANIPVVVWFAWSDVMRQAGIVDGNNTPKGIVYDKFFELAKSSTGVAPVGGGAAVEAANAQGINLAPADQLWVRQGPSVRNRKLRLAQPGEKLIALDPPKTVLENLGKENLWLKVRAADGTEGWSAAQYLKLAEITVAATEGLNIRSGPGTSHSKVGSVKPGALLTATESLEIIAQRMSQDEQWLKVRLSDGKEGWAAAWYLTL